MTYDELDRLKLCIKMGGVSQASVAEECGINKDRLSKALTKKIRLSSSELIAIAEQYPNYKYWIVFGEELPESGQISPMTDLLQKNKKR